jgi:HEAT repeat protein
MADETLDIRRIVNSIGSANEPDKQAEIVNNALAKLSIRQAADLCGDIAARSLDDLGFAKAMLVMLDGPAMNRALGDKFLGQLRFTLKNSDKLRPLGELIEAAADLDTKKIKFLKAKTAMLFQLIYLAKDRIQEEGLPALRLTAVDLAKSVLEDKELTAKRLRFDLNGFGRAYWNVLIEQLKEADFQSKDSVVYEMLLNDPVIEQAQKGAILASSGAGGVGEARLSDAVMARLGTNIIKRLNLLLRTIQMYQSADHPSVQASLGTLQTTMENAMQGREGLTISRVGSDLLIEDIKIKKKEKFLDDFIAALEGRNVNALTLKRGISTDEVRAFLMVFAQNEAQVKKLGGVRKIFESKGVTHVQVDQFRYGVISGDEKEATESLGADEKAVSNVVLSEILNRISKGEAEKLSAAELGQMLKDLLTGKDKSAKRTLAQMILALDPELAEQAVFSRDGVRDEMSWSSARKMIEGFLEDLGKGSPTDRIRTLDGLEKMTEVAVARNKETSLTQIIDKLTERLRGKEPDVEVLARLYDVLSSITRYLVLNGQYALGLRVLRAVSNMAKYCENLPAERKDDYVRAVAELSSTLMLSVSTPETLQALVREMESDDITQVETAGRILETLGTDQAVVELLEAFKSDSRSLRNRAFQTLLSMGERTLHTCVWKMKHLSDPAIFTRDPAKGTFDDDSFYVARNCLELIQRLGSARDVELIRQVSDDLDPRVRAEAISALAKLDVNEGLALARLRLSDSESVVAEAAVAVLGANGGPDAAPSLIDLFFAEPSLRVAIITALSRIGGADAEKMLLPAVGYFRGGALGKIARTDEKLKFAAIKALGAVGGPAARGALRRCVRVNSNLVLSAFLVPWEFRKLRKEVAKAAGDALNRINYRLQTKKTAAPAAATPAPPAPPA